MDNFKMKQLYFVNPEAHRQMDYLQIIMTDKFFSYPVGSKIHSKATSPRRKYIQIVGFIQYQ